MTRGAQRGLESLSKADLHRVDEKIHALADDPHPPGSKKLEGEDNLYRIRSGDYRVVYFVEAARHVVVVVSIGNRRDVYRP